MQARNCARLGTAIWKSPCRLPVLIPKSLVASRSLTGLTGITSRCAYHNGTQGLHDTTAETQSSHVDGRPWSSPNSHSHNEGFAGLLASYGARPHRENDLPGPGAWIASLNSSASLQELHVEPSLCSEPENVFEKSDVKPEIVQACLEAYIARLHEKGQPKERLQLAFGERKLGHHAMLWFCKQYGAFDAGTYPLLLRAIVHCMVAERGDGHLRHWRSLASPAARPHTTIEEKYDWKRWLLVYFAESKAFWSPNGLNDSIREFIHATEYDKKHFPTVKTFRATAGVWILRQLIYRQGTRGDLQPGLYEHFTDLVRTWKYDRGDHDFTVVRLQCMHPTDPDALPALAFLKEHEGASSPSIFIQDLFQPRDGRGASTLYGFIIAVARTLYSHGHESESRWVLETGKRLVPGFYGDASKAKSTRAPSAMRWGGAGARDLTFGADGYRVPTERERLVSARFHGRQ